jgi:transcriptional regulator with XRE-family HTH domain
MLPFEVSHALARLGEDLALARVRRKESQRQWASRMGISVPTLISLERGDPKVSMGIYATALWMMGLAGELGGLADPTKDLGALEADIRQAVKKRSVRSSVSVEKRLNQTPPVLAPQQEEA